MSPGATGENLVNAQTIITHATVRINDELAAPVVTQLRDGARLNQPRELSLGHVTSDRRLAALADVLAVGDRAQRCNGCWFDVATVVFTADVIEVDDELS